MTSSNQQLYEAARVGDLARVRELHGKGAAIVMAIMGATDMDEKVDERNKKGQKQCFDYAVENGASLLFSIQQPRRAVDSIKANSWFTRVHMIGGVGEVVAGTLKGGLKMRD